MNTEKTCQTVSTSSAATERLGERVGKSLKGAEVIELISDLGGGKTTFVRGLARGLGSTDHVASPTFTISKVYRSPRLDLWHFDFYRLEDAGHIKHELAEAARDPKNAVAVEWGGIVAGALPAKRLKINIKSLGDQKRQLELTCPKSLAYLVEAIC